MRYRFNLGIISISVQDILMFIFSVFFILKMNRAFSGSTVQGGIWNYIQLFFVALGTIFLIIHFFRYITTGPIMTLLVYVLIAMVNTLLFADLSQDWIFDYLMIPYALCVLIIAFEIGRYYDIERNIILTATFFILAVIFISSMISKGIYSTQTGAVADVYYLLCLLPLLMIYMEKLWLIPMSVCGIAILISGKRMGIILFVLMVLSYYLILSIKSGSIRVYVGSIIKLVLIIALFVTAFHLINASFNDNLFERINRIVEDNDSSGRFERWNSVLHNFAKSNVSRWIFGYGRGSVAKFFGGNAHNDFLEILYNYGIFAFGAYVLYVVTLIIEMFRMLKDRYVYAPQFVMAVICSIGVASFSFYIISPTYVTASMLSLGLIMMDYRKRYYPESRIAIIRN